MNPKVLIRVEGGCVVGVSTNVPGVEAVVYDQDALDAGEAHLSPVPLTYTGPWEVEPLTDEEKARFDAELVGNINGNATADVLIGIIDRVPLARVEFRSWLSEAEEETRREEEGSPSGVASGTGEDDPDHDTLLNHLARNGPWE